MAVSSSTYKLIRLHNGAHTVCSRVYGETMHPGLGPAVEAENLHVGQLKIRERLQHHTGEFVVWDVGLGAAANTLTLLRLTRDLSCPLRVVSFDDTLEPLAFALHHADKLGYLSGYESIVKKMLDQHRAEFKDGSRVVNWKLHLADFPSLITGCHKDAGERLERRAPARREDSVGVQASACSRDRPKHELQHAGSVLGAPPHAILFDAFSPAKNPAMWTLGLFENLFRLLDPSRPCALATYSRSTMVRTALLLAGFFVGRGRPTGMKEETTVAANTLALLDEPLDRAWLQRARISSSAEPLPGAVYRQSPLAPQTWERLQRHAQFV
jgi:queuine tRNA-ribosyltransferase